MALRTHIIAFGHKARRGKDTCAAQVIKTFGNQYDIRRYGFADELKREVNRLAATHPLGMRGMCYDWGVIYDESPDMTDPLSPEGKQRHLLVKYANTMRSRDPYIWVRKLEQRLVEDQPQIALVTDMRFMNEFWWIKDHMQGSTVRVEREGYNDIANGIDPTEEMELDNAPYDIVINCAEGEVDDLKRSAEEAFNSIINALAVPEFPTLYVLPSA